MTGKLQPLDEKFAIVGPDGRPTLYFTRWAQQRMQDIGVAITAEQAEEITNTIIDSYALQAGTGITITPDGKLSSNPTIAADIQALLDSISTTQGAILYRGASDWQALAPGTAGQVLTTGGAGADPTWAAGGGGGGGMTLIQEVVLLAPAASIDFNAIPNTYKNLVVTGQVRSAQAVNFLAFLLRFNGDTGFNYAYDRVNRFGASNSGAGSFIEGGSIPGSLAPADVMNGFTWTIPNYSGTLNQKTMIGNSFAFDGLTPISEYVGGLWKNTAAITDITVLGFGGNLETDSTVCLWGM